MLLTSFGVVIVVQSLLATFVSARPRAVPQPEWLSEAVSIAGISLRWQQILAILITAVALFGMRALLKRSFIGIAMQAAAQDFDATRLMGIKANRVISATFAISGLLAAAAAVIYLARSGTVQPTMGLTPVLFAFVATVLGGIGDLRGAVAGGFLLGIVEAVASFVAAGRSHRLHAGLPVRGCRRAAHRQAPGSLQAEIGGTRMRPDRSPRTMIPSDAAALRDRRGRLARIRAQRGTLGRASSPR